MSFWCMFLDSPIHPTYSNYSLEIVCNLEVTLLSKLYIEISFKVPKLVHSKVI